MAIEVTSSGSTEPVAAAPAASEAAKPADMNALNPEKAGETPKEVEAKPGEKIAADAEAKPEEPPEPIEEADSEELEAKATEDEEEIPDDSAPKKKKMGGFQRREKKLRDELDYWKTEALRKPQAQPEKVEAKPPTPDLSKRPRAEDFEKNDDYVEALAEYKLEAKLKERDEKQRQETIKKEVQTRINEHNERLNSFKETHDDFDEIYEAAADKIPYNLAVQQAILESDLGPDVMYELAKNPKEFKRICTLKPLQAAKEIGKIEARLTKTEALETPTETKTSKAPKPIVPVKSRGVVNATNIYDADISYEEFKKQRAKDERARLAGR